MKVKLYALLLGTLCHGMFVVGVGLMAISLYYGMQWGFGPFHGVAALVVNLLLVLQFPFVHSWFLSRRGGKVLIHAAPHEARRKIGTTLFALVASLQLVAVFALWSPSGIILWEASGAIRYILVGAYGAMWLVLGWSMFEAGLGVQTGFTGWWAVVRDADPKYKPFARSGLHNLVRHPIYLSFALILLTGPTWTPDRLLLVGVWIGYCAFGPRLKDKRYLSRHGEQYVSYQKKVPYILPRAPTFLYDKTTKPT